MCNAGSRILVEHGILDSFTERFRAKARTAFVPGNPLDPATTMGPLVTADQQARVLEYVEIGKQDGATLDFGGGVPQGLERGCYVEPTLFTGVENSMRIAREEIFGPVAGILSIRDADDAIANDSIYGLGGVESLLQHTQTKSVWLHIGDETA